MMRSMYNWNMVDYHLLTRKNKDGTYWFHAAFVDPTPGKGGRVKYRAMRSTGVEARKGKSGGWTETSKAAARRVAQAMIDDGRVFASRDDLETFLLDFWTPGKSEYLRSKESEGTTVSPTYCEGNVKKLKKYFLPWCKERGITKLSDLDRRNITAWRDWLYQKNKDSGITPTTQNKVRQALFVPLQWCVDMQMIPAHPGVGVKRVKEKTAERSIFQTEELGKLFSVPWDDIRVQAACLLAAETGMRLGEVRGLLFKNLHIEQAYLDVVTSYVDTEGLKPPKWGSVRLGVPISPRCVLTLREMMRHHRWKENPEGFVFYNIESHKRPIMVATINKQLRKTMKAAKLEPGRTFHSFRHSVAAHWNGPANALQRMLGHSAIEMTQHYANHDTDENREAIRAYQENIIKFPEAK